MHNKILATLLFALAIPATATVNYPYPQNSIYEGRGIIVQSASTALLKSKFNAWLSNFYVAQGSEARIKFDDPIYTVSEGIGYGMLMMVYMSDNTTSYESQFSRLWAYYKARRNSFGLMNWKINGFETTCSGNNCNGATDGDLDVALALLQGYYQFGVTSYLTDARALISAIRSNEIDKTSPYLLMPGDSWNDKKNPSYFSPGHMQLFQSQDAAGATMWGQSITDNYTHLINNQNSATGLFSDWATAGGAVNGDDKFGYEAVRIPWRLAMGYYWYGQSTAKSLLDKTGSWIITKTSSTPNNIRSEYNRSTGNLWGASYASASFTGAFAAAVTTNTANQSYLDAAWTSLLTFSTGSQYYHGALQILIGLLISGNMPNLASMPSNSSSSSLEPSSSSVELSSSSLEPSSSSIELSSSSVEPSSSSLEPSSSSLEPSSSSVYQSSSSVELPSSSSELPVAVLAQTNRAGLEWNTQAQTLHFHVTTSGIVKVDVLDLVGHLEATAFSGIMTDGPQSIGIAGLKRGVHLIRVKEGATSSALIIYLR